MAHDRVESTCGATLPLIIEAGLIAIDRTGRWQTTLGDGCS